jgi:hypothetical protein
LKPFDSAESVYSPGISAGKAYEPSDFVVKDFDSFVARLTKLTVAPGMMEFAWSTTNPEIEPVVYWARAEAPTQSERTRAANTLRARRWFPIRPNIFLTFAPLSSEYGSLSKHER